MIGCVCQCCAIWPHAEMASCLDEAFWKAIVFDSRWLGEKGVVASSRFLSPAPPPAPQPPSLLLLSPSPAKENPKAIVFNSRWLGEKGVVAASRARWMQLVIEASDGHHL